MSKSINLTSEQAHLIIERYREFSVPHTNNYTLFRAKNKTSTLTIFKTLTLLIQGSNSNELYQEICSLINITPVIDEAKNSSLSIELSLIGTDEVGTGDFFGGIVVAAAYVRKDQIKILKRLGVKDSKQLNDSKILELGEVLIKEIVFSVHVLDNLKYNYINRIQNYNMNKIKALLHNSAIRHLRTKVKNYDGIVIDAFTTKEKYFNYLSDEKEIVTEVKLEEKAESKYVSVAVASIIARYFFLDHFNKLSKEVGFELPKGAGPKIDLAIQKILKTRNLKYFETIAKTNFKNLDKYK
ncbi:MAG TPA: ribonuclease HIII [Bacilli bacterium]|nr:ribonuclease HIII [Bacilli bacterium]